MDVKAKLDWLNHELDERINSFAKKRVRDKNVAFGLKILAVCFAATITILLGLKVQDDYARIFQGIALVLSAIITVMNAIEAFYDHRSLWIQRTITLSRLYSLRADLRFTMEGLQDSELDITILRNYMNRYETILEEDMLKWLKMRENGSVTNHSGKGISTEIGKVES
jgi:hypothetical protein